MSQVLTKTTSSYRALFITPQLHLQILPTDCDRVKVVPLMDKALTPYVKGGGATAYEAELK